MTKTLKPSDVRDLLTNFAAAIKLDQLHVDGLAPEKFHLEYNDHMWRAWRRDHLAYLDTLLMTVNMIPTAMLEELTRIAITYKHVVVEQIALELFAECASGSCPREEVETAALFFGRLIKELGDRSEVNPTDRDDARGSMLQWLPVTDPLRISRDPECGYGHPTGLVS
jgi:hypothetical protein